MAVLEAPCLCLRIKSGIVRHVSGYERKSSSKRHSEMESNSKAAEDCLKATLSPDHTHMKISLS